MPTSRLFGVFFGCVLLAVTWQTASAASPGEYEELCRLFKNGTQIRKPGTCDQYIKCIDGEGTVLTCTSGQSFSPSKNQCVATLANSNKYCGNRCEGKHDVWVADPTECQKFFYCMNEVPLPGSCPEYQHFDEASQECLHTVDSMCVDVNNICELVPSKTKFRKEDDCGDYYECNDSETHTKKSCITTKKRQYFNVETGACVDPSTIECTAHSKTNICSKSTKQTFVSDQATCRGYFLCKAMSPVIDLDPTWLQCGEGYFFDSELQICAPASQVVCTFNRCEGRGTGLVASSSNNCHNFIRCVDSKTVSEETCHFDHFFDETISACTSTIIYDKCCDDRD